MRPFFSLAVNVMNRLNYTWKFMLMGLITLVALTVVVCSLFTSLHQSIQLSQRQLQGLALIEPITRTIQVIQQQRGISSALLSGIDTMRDRHARKAAEIDEAFKAMEEKLPSSLTTSEDFQRIKQNWGQLRKEGLHWMAYENFVAHTRLIDQIKFFEESAADDYGLTLDTRLDTYYLIDIAITKLPHTLEHLGQIRSFGTGILTRQQLSEAQQIALRVMIGELDNTIKHLNISLDKVSRYNPTLRNTLSAASNDITASAQQITDLAESDIFTGHFATPPEAFLDMATVQINNSYAQIYATLLPTTEALIKARIAKAEKTLYLSIGVTLLLFLIMGYFATGNYYVIISSIQSFSHAAQAFAGGDLKMRVKLDTRDELRHIGDSFNTMADGFNVMFEKHREDKNSLRATIETAMDAVVQMDAQGIITGWNQQAEKVFGWHRAEVIGRPLDETIIPPQFREKFQQGLQRFQHTGDCSILNSRVELLSLHRDGHEFPVELSMTAIMTAGKHRFNCFIRDITQKKQSEDLIWKQANFDPLTSLPNRRMFHDRLEQAIKKAQRANLKTALLYIDLDKFKEVNDTLGHNMGDALLQEAARRISSCVRATDTVARMGGDEFTVILAELDDTGSIGRVTDSILQSLAEPFLLGSEAAYISASIGVTLYPDDATDINELLMHADQAMYAAKHGGRNRYSYFTPPMQHSAQARLRLTNELRGALAANQLMLHYQPIVDLATGQIVKAEALLRWQHPELGAISPAQFIPLAEETGLIVEIGDWVFKEAARQLKYWRALYNINLQISVNVSPVQFGKTADDTFQTWFSYVQDLGLPSHSMVIEITEGLLLSASGITDKLLDFHDAGIQVAIDDFGTGYSSLSYLKKFDIDYLKIDQSFVRDLATDANDMALSEAIIVMAHKLGLQVIAEGVETEEQRKLLIDAGCDYAQGYLYSRSIPAATFEVLLGKQPGDPIAPHGYSTTMAAVT